MNLFAERLLRIRTARGLSQAALASACGLSQSAIANYENGSRRMAKDIFTLADALDVNPMWLALGTGPQAPLPPLMETRTSYQVEKTGPAQQLAPWPFSGTSPDEYWSLPAEARAVIDSTLASLIKSLRKIG